MYRKLQTHQLNRLTIYQYQTEEKIPLVLVLDNIRSMKNVGSIFRTADGFGVEALALCGITAKPPHRDIHKTALGAEDAVQWTYHEQTLDACLALKAKGYRIVAVEQVEGSIELQNFNWDKNTSIALVLGNETDGVDQSVLDVCDNCIEIPQFGTKHSFNVSVCTGIVLWALCQ